MSENKITKNDIVDNLYSSLKLNNCERKVIYAVVDAFIDQLKNGLENGSTIELRGFGTFEPRLRNRSEARNPKTGEKCSVEPHYVAAFRAGKELKENLWNLPVKSDEKKD